MQTAANKDWTLISDRPQLFNFVAALLFGKRAGLLTLRARNGEIPWTFPERGPEGDVRAKHTRTAVSMEEDWIRQLEEGGIDLEAQGRELERRKQEHSDRLVAEAIQRDLSLKGEEGGERGENAIERVRREVELFSQSQSDAEIARVLQEAEQSGREGREGEEDALLVQRLQREENDKLQQEFDEQLAIALQNEHKEADTSRDEEMARVLSAEFESTADASTTASTSSQLLASQPNWWSPCPTNSSCKYHLIEISRGSSEWEQVTTPFRDAGFTPQRLQRVQNIQLYQRLQFEKQTMQMDREDGYQVNERLLFHTTAAAVSVICSEGLDQRLSRRGRFGSGVYFR